MPDCDGIGLLLLVVVPFTSLTLMRLSLETDFDCVGAPVLDVAALVFWTWMELRLFAMFVTSLIWFFLMFIFETLMPLVVKN